MSDTTTETPKHDPKVKRHTARFNEYRVLTNGAEALKGYARHPRYEHRGPNPNQPG